MRASLSLLALLAGVSLAHPALAQSEDDKLGKVHFETSCNADAQKLFDRGMRYQHSFWYRASQKMFEDTLKADPGLQHRLLGHRPQPVVESAYRAAGEEFRGGSGGDRES